MRIVLALLAALLPAIASAQMSDIDLGGVEPFSIEYQIGASYTGSCSLEIQGASQAISTTVSIPASGFLARGQLHAER